MEHPLSEQENKLYELLTTNPEPMHIDAISSAMDWDIGETLSALTLLELWGYARQMSCV